MSTKEIAKELAFLSQGTNSPEDVTVRDVVGIGRYPYQGIFQKKAYKMTQSLLMSCLKLAF